MKLLFSVLLIMPYLSSYAVSLADLLPKQINEWSVSDTDQYFNNETLYDYIDGGAELYLSYGFNNVISRRFSSPGEMDIVVEIFDMKGVRDAFGVFTNMREKNQHEFGQGSQHVQGSIIFWKDHFFISVSTNKNSEKSLAAMRNLASFIDKAIPDKGTIPGIVRLLPLKDLAEDGYCYFHHYIWLNSYYYIANYNILNINENTDALLAKYGSSQNRSYFLMVQYPDTATAKAGYDKFISEFSPELKTSDAIKLKDNTWHTAALKGTLFLAVFNSQNREDALNLMKSVNATFYQ